MISTKIRRFIINNHKENHLLVDQMKLLNELPANLRFEVISHTHGDIIKKIKFFSNKGADFFWECLPLLKSMKVHAKDILYN